MKHRINQLLLSAAVLLGLSTALFHLRGQSSAQPARPVTPRLGDAPVAQPPSARLFLGPAPSGSTARDTRPSGGLTFKLNLESGSDGVVYVIQSSSNLTSWQTLLSLKSKAGVVSVADVSATNQSQFFRLISPPGDDTNAPAWGTNGTQGKLVSGPPGRIVASWAAANDETGVSEYRVFINGALFTNVLGSTLSTQFTIDPHARNEIRIQAADAFGNATLILLLSVMPGDNLVAVSDDSGRVFVFQYQPGNTNLFSSSLRIADLSSNDRGLGIGDFDRDGFLDIVAGTVVNSRMACFFYKGRGDGTFAQGVPLPVPPNNPGGYVMEAAVGDFDSDGNLDIVFNCNNTSTPNTYFFWGNGDGTFVADVKQFPDYGRGMTAGDFNEDGREDIVRGENAGPGRLRLFLSNGDRTFAESTNFVGTYGSDRYGVVAGDFDEDGHVDVMANNSSSGDVVFYKGLGDGTFLATLTNGVLTNLDVNTYSAMDTFDYDRDGHLDLVMSTGNGQAFFWTGNGDGSFSTNRVQIVTGISGAFGVSAPPHPPRVDVNIAPTNPVIALNGSVNFSAAGSGVAAGDGFRWTFGDESTNTYAWNFTNGMPNMGQAVSHTYTKEGKLVARLWHTSAGGVQSTRGTVVTIQGNPPVADPGGPYVLGEIAATQGVWTATLRGTNSSDDFGITSYIWNFGDGTTLTNGAVVSHGWPSNGVWTVGLLVTDAAGQTSSNATTVTFNNGALPVAVISGPSLADETVATNGNWFAAFSGTNSTDDFGIWKYDWNFGNGRTATGPNVTTTYGSVGTFNVRLTVTDNAGQTNSATNSITVKANALPKPVISGERFLTEAVATNGLWFGQFTGTNSTDDKGIYQYAWKFGDGGTATGGSVTHNYAGTGVYPLVLTVTDFGDQSVSVTQNVIVVAGELPVPRITANPLTPEGAQPVDLDATASTDDHGILSYRWLLPPQRFDFEGNYIDPNVWRYANAIQDGKMLVTGFNNWDSSYFFSGRLLTARGGALQGRVDTPTGSGTYAMVGLRNTDTSSGNFNRIEHAIYFNDGQINIYELGSDRGKATNYDKGNSYDFRIESKPGAGAVYYLRPSGTGADFVKIFDSSSRSDSLLGFGVSVFGGTFGFDDFVFEGGMLSFPQGLASVYPGGKVTLEVADNALQTNTASVTLTTITGAPPVAVINGPTNGLAGVELNFDGYFSSDDHAIASYVWNFGDGTPKGFGPAVVHRYDAAGTYTNRLTVFDYAGQSSSASLVLTITGGNLLVTVPWRIIGGIEQPHEVYAGKVVTVKAVARRVPVPFDFIWDLGDGSAPRTNSVTNAVASGIYNLQATNAYTGVDGTPFYANIRVILTNGTVLSDTYPIVIRPKTIDTEMKVAIDEGLWNLQQVQSRFDIDTNNRGGNWDSGGYKINPTASAVHAFGINGHTVTDDTSQDPYVETVQRGINYLLTALITQSIDVQAGGDPDGNHNGIGLYGNTGQPIYETGPVLDALVAATRPELIAQVGGANVLGRTFKDIMQDLVDTYCWGQYDDPAVGGGWRYSWNSFPDNSTSQWGAIGMYAAEHFWGIPIPQWVKDRNVLWVRYSKGGTGYGYTGPGDGIALTPSALVQLAFDGVPTTNELWLHGDKFLANNWTAGQNVKGANNVYANYAIAKSMRTAVPQAVHNLTFNGFDWFLDPVNGMARFTVDRQRTDGSWADAAWVQPQLATAWSVIILSSSLFQRGPVAVITMKPNPAAVGFPIVFDARGSYHQHPAYKVAEYRWDFDPSNGLDFEHPDAIGPVATNSYSSLSTNSVSLQVRDNATPFLSDVASIVVRVTIPPYPPTPDAGGPYYVAVGEDVHLDGSGSFDVDAAQGDFIQSYDWEIDFQQPLDFADDVTGRLAVITNGFATPGPHQIALRVKDATSIVFPQLGKPDLTADDFTVVYAYDRVITDLKARPKANKIQLTWTKKGDYVIVMRSTLGPDRGFQEVGRTSSSYTTFLDTNTEYNVEYYYRLIVFANSRPDPIGISDSEFIVSRQRGLEDHPPVFESYPIRIARVGDLYNPTLDAQDPENDPIVFNLLAGPTTPTNMTVNASNGLVNYLPAITDIGSHTLTFEATNAAGRDVISFSLFVLPASNSPPVAVVGGPYAALIGDPIQFSSAGTSDPDNDPLYITWSFGDGTTSSNANPTHAFGAPGTYLVSLFVNDGYGGTALAKTTAVITRPNRPPTATIAGGPNFTSRLGETLALDGSASFDLDGDPIAFTWIWGDGATTGSAANSTASHSYTASGSYAGQLVVADNRGGSGTSDFNVAVAASNQVPTVVLNLSSNSPYANTEVTFDANGTTDPEGDPLTFEWDFGDRFKSTGRIVTHVYRQIGDFPLTLTVRDSHGGSTVVTQAVHALNAPPQFTSTPPLLVKATKQYSYTPTVTDINGDTVTFQLTQGPLTMSCDTNTGALAWLPGTNDVGPNAVVLRAFDSRGGSNDQAFNVVVTSFIGPEVDLEPIGIVMSNVVVDSVTLTMTGTVRVLVRNNGDDPVPVPFTVSAFVDADFDGEFSTNADSRVSFGTIPAGLAKGFIAFIDMSVHGQALFKDAPLSAFVDSEGVVPEYNETNNVRRAGFDVNTNNPPVLDVSASSLQVDRSGLPGSAMLIARLGNSGFVNVPTNVAVAFYDGDPASGGTLLGVARSTTVLEPGRFEDVSINWNSPVIAKYTVFVVADDDGTGAGALTEITKANNRFSAQADLTANLPPIANAGPDQSVLLGDYAVLNGSDSKDPENRPLKYNWSFLSFPIGSRAILTGGTTAQPYFQPDVAGPYTLRLVVNDGTQDSTNTDTVVVTGVDTNANHYPDITSKPSFQGMVSNLYTYAVVATDEDGDPLTFSLGQSPSGMTINRTNGLIQFTPTSTGSFFVQVNVFDSRGAGVYQSWTITVIPFQNLAPKFTSVPPLGGNPGSNYTYNATATDGNNDTVTFALAQKPTGMNVNGSSGAVTWTPTVAQQGGNLVVLTASDGKGGVSTQAFTVVVFTPGADGPIVQPIPDQTVVGPAAFATVSLDSYVFDPNDAKSSLTWTFSGTNKLVVTINSNRIATITYPAGTITSERITFLATDPSGKSGGASALYTVRAADNPPVAKLANLSDTDTTSITTGTFELKGTADDPDAIDPVAYRVRLYDADGVLVRDVTPGPVNAAGWHEGRVAAGGSLGTLDFTVVRNGGYTLQLEVQGGDLIASITASIAVDSNLKLGQYKFSQQDAVVPVGGAVIRIIRTYDSLNTSSADFGYSWTHTVSDLDVTFDEQRVQETDLFDEKFSLRVGGSRDVTLDMPDTGRRVTFRYSLDPGGLFRYRASWTPPPGINATLVPTVSPNLITLWSLQYWEAAPPETGIDGFDFPGFILTLQDGSQYRVDREFLGDHFIASDSSIGSYSSAYGKAYLTRINDPNGERTELVRQGTSLKSIEKYSATGQKLKTVLFQRDANKRITAVYTPENLDTNNTPIGPATVTYEYDSVGNLSRVNKLSDASNPTNLVYATTTYIYGNARYPHYITEIRDPRGVPTMRTEYDAAGRIVATVDGAGKRTEIQHDLASQTETVYDRLGNPTLYAYDDRGNVVAKVDALGGVTRKSYDANNYVAVEVDPLGHTNQNVHDSAGNLLSHTDPLGNVTTSTYDGAGRLLTTTDPLGHVTYSAYDSRGNLTNSTDAAGNVTTYTFDASNRRTSVTDPAGKVTRFEYDGAGNVSKETDSLGTVTAFTYDGNGYLTSETTVTTMSPGVFRTNSTHTTYNADGAPTSVTDSSGYTRKSEYDPLGNLTARIDALGNRTEYTYDERSHLLKVVYPDHTSLNYAYDDMGQRISSTDRAGRTTYYQYDALGRLLATVYPADPGSELPIVRNEYDTAGRLTALIDERGNRTSYAYDAAGRQIASTNALGFVTTSTYDAAGRKVSDSDALGNTTFFLYDNLDRLVRTIYADGTSTRSTYDAMGRVITEVDQAGAVTSYEYDSVGKLTAVVDPLGQRTTYAYNEAGDLILQRDAKGRETRYEGDPITRTTSTVLPGGQRSTTLFNAVGNLAATTNFNGQTTRYEYDANGRVSAQRFPSGRSVEFTYTPIGRRQSVADSRGVTAFTYDARDHLSMRTDPDGRSIQYQYDLSGNRTKIITCDPASSICNTQSYAYDALNRMVSATAPDGGVTTYNYDAANNLLSAVLPNGTVRSNAYDTLNRLTAVENRSGTNVLSSHRYTLGVVGNRTAVQELGGRQLRYDYDVAQQLTGERVFGDPAGRNRTNSYAYDAVGNRLTFSSAVNAAALAAESAGYAYDNEDRLLAETNLVTGEVTAYTYDNNGNTLTRSNSLQNATFSWSADNRLTGATIVDAAGAHQLTFDYDADGNRVGATVLESGTTRRINYLVDANRPNAQVLEEWSTLNGQPASLSAGYAYGASLISQNRSGARSYYHPDGLGSTRVLTDGNGAATDRYEYDAYGRVMAQSGATENNYLFAGEERDPNLGLDYLRARYMAPGLGRFFGRDPATGDLRSPLRRHPYLYAGNDPVNKVDPSGKQFDLISISISLSINTTLDAYQVAFAKAGLNGIRRTTKIVDHVLSPAIKIQEMALDLMDSGLPGAEQMFALGQELEQMAYRLLQSVIAGIYVETFNSAKISFTLGPIKGELGFVSGSIEAFGKKAEYGADLADYDATMQKILDGIDKQIQGIENPPTIDTKLEEGADEIFKWADYALDKLGSGPGKWEWSNKKE